MAHSHTIRILTAATAVAVLLAMAPLAGAQEPKHERGVTNVVLIHGAWADGSSWSKVIPLLAGSRLHVLAVQLPLTSLADDVATVKRAIAPLDGPVLLVAHSYGGVVMTEAGNDPKVAGLVYVAAFAPSEGQSAFDLATAFPTPILPELQLDAFGFLTITPAGVRQDFAQDVSSTEQLVLTVAQTPTAAAAALSAPVSSAAWRNKPSWFVIASRDRVVAPVLQRMEADQMNATSVTLPAGHVAMLSQPYAVAAVIRRAARDVR